MNKKTKNKSEKVCSEITREEAIKKMGKYAALTAFGTFMILNPKIAPKIKRYNVAIKEKETINRILETTKSALLFPLITCCLKVLKVNSLQTKITSNIPINKLNQLPIYVRLFHTLGKLYMVEKSTGKPSIFICPAP